MDNFEEKDDLYDLDEKALTTDIVVSVNGLPDGTIEFSMPPVSVLSVEDLRSRLEVSFPEYNFIIK